MSQKVVTNYIFDAAEGILTLPDYDTLKIEGVISIENLTKKEKFYPENDILVASNTIDFVKPLVGYSSSDKFRIIYDDGASSGTLEGSTAGGTSKPLLVDEDGKTYVRQGDLNSEIDSVTVVGKDNTFEGLSASSNGANLLPPTDVSAYETIKVNISAIGTGNFVQFAFSETGSGDWQAEITVGAVGPYIFARKGKYFKATITTYGSGTVSGQVTLIPGSITDISTGKIAYPAPPFASQIGYRDNSDNIVALNSLAKIGDNASGNSAAGIALAGYDGSNISRLRYANTVKSLNKSTTGDTPIWTPSAGRRYRLLGYIITISSNATLAAAGMLAIKLRDGTTVDIVTHNVYVPQTAENKLASDWSTGFVDLGAGGGLGVQGGAVTRALNLSLSTALATGIVDVQVFGTED